MNQTIQPLAGWRSLMNERKIKEAECNEMEWMQIKMHRLNEMNVMNVMKR